MKKAIAVLKYMLSLGLAAVLLYYAFRNIDFVEFMAKAQEVDFTWVIISILLSMVAYYARAWRWNILLKPLGYTHLTVHRTNLAILVGYLANLAFPRLGEVTRCGLMKRNDQVNVSESLGTVITERIIDLLSLFVLIGFALILEYDKFLLFLEHVLSLIGDPNELIGKALIFLSIAGVLFIALMWILYRKVEKVRSFINELVRGIISLKNVKDPVGFIVSTLLLWVTYYYMSYLIVFSVPESAGLNWEVGIMLLVTGGIALAVPVQGGIGTYHVLISAMLALYGVDATTGVFLATLLHTSQIIAVAIFGGIALLISFFVIRPRVTNDAP